MHRLAFFVICILLLYRSAHAQECVVSDLITRVPIRDVKVTVDSIVIGHTTWRGTCQLPRSFHTASFEKRGYMKETLTEAEVRRDTVFLVPAEHSIDEVTVWGHHVVNADSLRKNIPWKDHLYEPPHSRLEFNFAKMIDRRYRRDMKQLRKMRQLFREWDNGTAAEDPVMRAYKQTQAEKERNEAEAWKKDRKQKAPAGQPGTSPK